jgi:hypothetical protein
MTWEVGIAVLDDTLLSFTATYFNDILQAERFG